jgi:catechol 2,3-dioxygenase-like lactoylglutathione lyase family enzyme
MSSRLHALTIAAVDPARVADFWGDLLGRPVEDDRGRPSVLPDNPAGFRLVFEQVSTPLAAPNRIHLHLTSESASQQETVDRALALGGRHLDVGQLPDEDHVVLADPEGNAFCVIEAGNNFLAGTGFLGELACDGTRDVGVFWGEALGWPLVWDENEETAIQSPAGGTKVAWGGPPLMPRDEPDRLRFEVVAGGDRAAEVRRFVALGAQVVVDDPDVAALTDPDGTAFTVR